MFLFVYLDSVSLAKFVYFPLFTTRFVVHKSYSIIFTNMLLASAAETCSSLAGHWVGKETSPRLCHIARRLLQHCFVFRAQKVTVRLQHVENAAALVWSQGHGNKRGLSRLMHDDLHWLVICQRVQYKLALTVHRCFRHRAPWYMYLADYSVPVSERRTI